MFIFYIKNQREKKKRKKKNPLPFTIFSFLFPTYICNGLSESCPHLYHQLQTLHLRLDARDNTLFLSKGYQAILTATGFPRPMEKPLVPSGMRGTEEDCLAIDCSMLTVTCDVPTAGLFPRLLTLCVCRPRPFPLLRLSPDSRLLPFLATPPSLS